MDHVGRPANVLFALSTQYYTRVTGQRQEGPQRRIPRWGPGVPLAADWICPGSQALPEVPGYLGWKVMVSLAALVGSPSYDQNLRSSPNESCPKV